MTVVEFRRPLPSAEFRSVGKDAYEEDLPGITGLWVDMFREENGCNPGDPVAWVIETVTLMESGNYLCIIASVDNKDVGFVDFFFYNDQAKGGVIVQIRHLYVSPRYRGTGVSRNLLLKSLRAMKNAGCSKIRVVPSTKRRLQYERAGFKEHSVILEREMWK